MTSSPTSDPAAPLPLTVVNRRSATTPSEHGRLRTIVAAALVILAVGGVRLIGLDRLAASDPAAPVSTPAPAPPVVFGLGRLLPDGDVLAIAAPFGAGDARIAILHVAEGDRVAAGAPLATLDNAPALAAAIEAARATVAAREATLTQVRLSVDASREEARAGLARAEATLANAERSFERTEALRVQDVAALATLDQRRAARDEARREVDRLRATLGRFASADPDGQADVLVAARTLDAARADLARATVDQDKAQVRAPRAGTVLTLHARPGERPGLQGLLSFGDVDAMTAEVEVHESAVGRVAVGDRAEVMAAALPRALAGTVVRLGLEVRRQALVDPSPAANTDARVIPVTIGLDPSDAAAARHFTNLQVRVRIAVRDGR